MGILRAVLLLTVGIIAGLLVARYLPRDNPGNEPDRQSRAPGTTATDIQLAGPIVTLRASSIGKLQSASPATVVGPNIVIASITAFAGAQNVAIETRNGRVVPVRTVLAADERYGIAALATEESLETEILRPEPGAGSLWLGRRVALLTGNGRHGGEVDDTGYRDELGGYNYAIRLTSPGNAQAAAIVDPETGRLLGLVRGRHDGSRATAMDCEPINLLIDRVGQASSRNLAEFSRYYFSETTPGRLALLGQFVASEQFLSAIEIGKDMLNLDAYTQKYGAELLQQAYSGAARQSMTNGQWRTALLLLDDADGIIGLDEELRLMRAESRQAVGELEGALDDLLALGNRSAHDVRMLVIENALATGQTNGGTSLSLLQRALAADPDYAPYHRLLGETLARRGDMPGALAALERAIMLEPDIATEVAPLLSRLRARRNTPPLTEVPIQRRRNTLFVKANINGSTEAFRLLLDTGASYTAITTSTALRLGIKDIFFGAPVVQLETANGRVYTTTATLNTIDVGGARVDNVEAVILESMSGVDGLLGQSFLRHFDVNIDRTRGVIAFNRRLDE